MRVLLSTIGLATVLSLGAAMVVDQFLSERIAILGSFAGLVRSYNTGIAFSLSLGPLQNLLIVAVLIVVAVVAFRTAKTLFDQIGFGLIVGGGLANVIDRLLDGRVTDFFQVGTFPIFNLADACINVGIACLLFAALRKR